MAKYRKKPVVIEAFKLGRDGYPIWTQNTDAFVSLEDGSASIQTLEGVLHASLGDYIIQGVKGELYPCKPDIFEATYDTVE
jgi:hypothetical protein